MIFFFQTIGNLDLLIFYDILCLIVSLLWPSGICIAATMATTASLSTAEVIYESDWYTFPMQLRKHLPFMMSRSQLEISFNGYGIIGCDLTKLVKVK